MTGHAPKIALGAVLASLAALPAVAGAAEIATDEEDRTLSPYFHVDSDDPDTDRLPLEETSAEVSISGVIAHVEVVQTYVNEGERPLEAVYVFPGGARSAVFDMRMTIGDRVIEADIEKKAAARKIYENAREAGQSASLLEQKRPNVFQMNVANIMPGDEIEVELHYVEALVPEEGVYEFVYPSVVGPRYSEETAHGDPEETWIENPHLPAGEAPPYRWNLRATLSAGMPIQRLRSPSHELDTRFRGRRDARLRVTDRAGGDRDFVLRYALAGGAIDTGLLLHSGEEENFFLAMIQPPERVRPAERPPREYVFIVDVSGSMRGFPIDTAKGVMRELLGGLGSRDRFNLMMFSGGSNILAERSLRATPENVRRGLGFLDRQRGGGGTRIRQALQRALAMPRSEAMSTSFVVVTDGYVSVEKETFDLIRENLGEANLFSFGIGSSVNRFLVEGMARAGMGEPFVVLGPEGAGEKAAAFRRYIESPVLTDVEVAFDGFRAYDVVPSRAPDVFAEKPLLVFGKYEGAARGHIRVTGRTGQGRYRSSLDVARRARAGRDNAALRYLWARHQIQELADYRKVSGGSSLADEITELGLRYSLMTEFTSFVAVDSRVRNEDGERVAVRQPLPMPEGVPNSAIGGGGRAASAGAARAPTRRRAVRRQEFSSADAPSPAPEPDRSAEERDDDRNERAARAARAHLHRAAAAFRDRIREQRGGELGGAIRVEVVIAPDGRVARVRVLGSSLGDAEVRRRLLRHLRRLRVAPPRQELTVRLRLEL